jgi:hypothetical protein
MADAINSVNPVFVNFTTVSANETVTLDGEENVQRGDLIIKHFCAHGAKMGYGIGYAGLPVAQNISYDGPDVPFADACGGIKWGRAVLCKAKITPASEGTEQEPAKPKTVALTALDPQHITGTCYGTTIKDCSVQLNAAIAVANGASVEAVPANAPGAAAVDTALVIAIMANASAKNVAEQGEEEDWEISEEGETVIAISEAIDPTVFNAPNGLQFQIPNATGGYSFTVRGTLAKAPFVRRVSNYTSMKDRVSSYPTSQAILDAKVGE